MNPELRATSRIVSAKGGTLDFVSLEGELLASIAIPAGMHYAKDYLELVPAGATVELSEGLVALDPPHRCASQPYSPDGEEVSGANPDFQPTSARRNELEMRLLLSRMGASTKRLEAREKALAVIERIPSPEPVAAVPEAAPVVPDEDVKPVVK
ncbi:hypothetical protein [Pseudotabrizicola sp. 4114]|uniref:hypothetical protein n=1 Tax=Pseudotabrizicola sp. 4114 TaxID=2817731 RepID=UPI00285C6937|nr:hypothetical protein [Pseudorhodobacter sp. 4114]